MKDTFQKLKEIEPTEETLRAIKARIDARIGEEGRVPLPSPYMRMNRMLVAGCGVAVLFLAFSFTLNTDPDLERGLLSARMAFSPNAHTKSELVLASLEKNSALVPQVAGDAEAYERIDNMVSLSRETLDTLKLMGEEDKYTLEECLGDYKRYFSLLNSIEGKLASSPLPQEKEERGRVTALRDKVRDAMEEAEDRLGKYPTE